MEIDPYQLFIVVVFGSLGIVTVSMLAVAVWLFRRNRRLPRLVKPRRGWRRAPQAKGRR
jgi:hypothetical protein